MARAPFSIYTRKRTDGKLKYSAKFFGPDGSIIKTVALTEAKSRTAAARIAEGLLREGVVADAKNPDALDYLRAFWTRDSDYVKGRALRGVVISDKYLYENQRTIESLLSAHLEGRRLLEIDPGFLEGLVLALSRAGTGPRRVNIALQTIRVPFAYFCRINRIANALPTVEKVREKPKERGILSAVEVGKIIALEGESPRVIAAVLLGALCGLRLGEVRALQRDDVDEDSGLITIRRNIVSEEEGVKKPKWGSIRTVPAPRPVLDALIDCAAVAPEERGPYVLWNQKRPSAPMTDQAIRFGFERVMKKIGIPKDERFRRNLCFHGLRHTFVTLSRAGGVPDFVVQRMVGHRSMVMTDRYSHAEGVIDFAAAREAMEKAVGGKKQGRQVVGQVEDGITVAGGQN